MSTKAKTIARGLLRQNRKLERAWRVIAREDFGGRIPAGTLCRFALSNGTWIPKNEYQILLGLKREKKTAIKKQPKDLFDMATSTLRKALINREPMPPIDARILREFKRLGWITKART